MAGFVGSINFSPTANATITQSTDELRRGYCRKYQECSPYPPLPAVELEPTGATNRQHVQLLSNEERSVVLLGSGEIFNHAELQRRLEGRAHRFGSTSSLEAALHVYEDEGTNCLALLTGQFALAIWDQPHRRLILACDSVGQKTIYYAQVGDRLVFATRLDKVRQLANRHQIDALAIDAYLTFGFVPRPLSMIEGICRLRPGRCLVFEQGGLRIDVVHQWSLPDPLFNANANSVAGALRKSVRIAASGARPEIWNDYSLSSRLVAAAGDDAPMRSSGQALPVDAVAVTEAANLIDEPVASLQPAELLLGCRSSNATDQVTLTGVGGAEALLVAPHYSELDWMQWGERLPHSAWQQLSRRFAVAEIGSRGYRQQRRRLRRLLEAQVHRPAQRHLRLIADWSEQERAELYTSDFVQHLGDDPARFLSRTRVATTGRDSTAAVARDLLVAVPDRSLAWMDQVFSSQNMRHRHPWLDEAVLDQSLSFLLSSPWGRASRRLAIATQLGAAFKPRSTRPHAMTAERLCQSELSDLIRDSLMAPDAAYSSFLDSETVHALVRGQFAHGGVSDQVVSLLMLELCLRRQRSLRELR